MSKQLESFRGYLEEFATKHKDKIRKNPQFRGQFQEMCASIGVDPLACEAQSKTLRPRQNGRNFADDISKCIFLNENV